MVTALNASSNAMTMARAIHRVRKLRYLFIVSSSDMDELLTHTTTPDGPCPCHGTPERAMELPAVLRNQVSLCCQGLQVNHTGFLTVQCTLIRGTVVVTRIQITTRIVWRWRDIPVHLRRHTTGLRTFHSLRHEMSVALDPIVLLPLTAPYFMAGNGVRHYFLQVYFTEIAQRSIGVTNVVRNTINTHTVPYLHQHSTTVTYLGINLEPRLLVDVSAWHLCTLQAFGGIGGEVGNVVQPYSTYTTYVCVRFCHTHQ